MTPPSRPRKVLVIVDDRREGAEVQASVPIRRYRLARLRFDEPVPDSASRYEHLARTHD